MSQKQLILSNQHFDRIVQIYMIYIYIYDIFCHLYGTVVLCIVLCLVIILIYGNQPLDPQTSSSNNQEIIATSILFFFVMVSMVMG